MLRRRFAVLLFILALPLLFPTASSAGVKIYEGDDGSFVEIGGRVQLQYRYFKPSGDGLEAEDALFFRRLRPYIKGTVLENWVGMIQVDFGRSVDSDELAVKDAYFRYSGFSNPSFQLTFGNIKGYFSREFLTSSKKNQLVERTFVGDHNYGVLGRVLGVHFLGSSGSGKVQVGLSLGSEAHDPGAFTMDFDSPVNDSGDWNQGWTAAGRVDFFPTGKTAYDQGDFNTGQPRVLLGAGGFGWTNDGDRNLYTEPDGTSNSETKADLDSAVGATVDAGFRGKGVSADAQVNLVHGKTRVKDFTGGLYKNGETDLLTAAIEAGVMVVRDRVELVAAYDLMDASNFMETWQRFHGEVNVFIHKNTLKFQIEYIRSMSLAGVKDVDADNVLVQGQFYF